MTILDKIINTKEQEVDRQRSSFPVEYIKKLPEFGRKCNSLKSALLKQGSSGIIAEFKHRSPSKGVINIEAKVEEVTKEYVNAGAAGLSVLTDHDYFEGTLDELRNARRINPHTPILRKDFIIDTYQIVEAKAYGADVVLLIAACLKKEQIDILAKSAKDLGMEVLMEIHKEDEIKKISDYVDIIGVNNRNLKTFKVDIDTSVKLSGIIPKGYLKITESGISDIDTITYLKQYGYKGFLIGETFMKTENPGMSCNNFILGL